jgi:hypothetical protein
MIEKVFSGTMSDFAKFIPPKELVYKLTQSYTDLQYNVRKVCVLVD